MVNGGALAELPLDAPDPRPKKPRGPRRATPLKAANYRTFVDMCQDLMLTVNKDGNINVSATHFVLDQGLSTMFSNELAVGGDLDAIELTMHRRTMVAELSKRVQLNLAVIPDVEKHSPSSLAQALCKPRVPKEVVNYMQTIIRVLERNGCKRNAGHGAPRARAP